MYDGFKPIQPIEEQVYYNQETEDDQKVLLSILQSEKDMLLEKVRSLEKDITQLRSLNDNLSKEKESLLREIDILKAENKKLADQLKHTIEERDKSLNMIKELENTFLSNVRNLKLNAVFEMLDLIRKVLRGILDSSYFPHEETIIKAISKVFERSIDIKGNITLRVSPMDFELFSRLISNLSDTFKGEISIDILEDKGLSVGEFIIETPKFWVERKKDEIIEDALHRALRDVQDIQ